MGKQIWKDVPGITHATPKEETEFHRRNLNDPIQVMHRLAPPAKTPDQTKDAKGSESPESRRPRAPQLPLPIYAPVAWDSSGCTRRAKWLKAFRRRLELTQAVAARELGYRARDISRIEAGTEVRIPAKLQQQLAESKRPGAFENRASWILDWRQRMGISQRAACRLLGYFGENAVGRIKFGQFQPSWEKILIAILEEERGSALERTSI